MGGSPATFLVFYAYKKSVQGKSHENARKCTPPSQLFCLISRKTAEFVRKIAAKFLNFLRNRKKTKKLHKRFILKIKSHENANVIYKIVTDIVQLTQSVLKRGINA